MYQSCTEQSLGLIRTTHAPWCKNCDGCGTESLSVEIFMSHWTKSTVHLWWIQFKPFVPCHLLKFNLRGGIWKFFASEFLCKFDIFSLRIFVAIARDLADSTVSSRSGRCSLAHAVHVNWTLLRPKSDALTQQRCCRCCCCCCCTVPFSVHNAQSHAILKHLGLCTD